MRLLNVHSFEFEVFYSAVPKYVIASHRWSEDEAAIKDVVKRRNTSSTGYRKVQGYVEYVKKAVPGVDWLWIDTVCINQDSSLEVSEAVNSMFRYYRGAELCIAYLADVTTTSEDLNEFRSSQWFSRGWTLQEMLAPKTVLFVTRKWQVIGHKGTRQSALQTNFGPSLENTIFAVTGIPETVLDDYSYSKAFSAQQKLEWVSDRMTTRPEDLAYCLLGMFDVTMPIMYGEGRDKARKRLLAEITNLSNTIPTDLGEFEVVEKPSRSLHEAAGSGDLEYITQLMETTPAAAEQLWKWDAGGSLPLHRAVQSRQALSCRLLMTLMNRQTWEPVDLLDNSGKSPVLYALSDTGHGSEDVIREFLTNEGLCFSASTILLARRSVLRRVLDIGGPEALQRAIVITRKVMSPMQLCDLLRRTLPTLVALAESDGLVPYLAAEIVKLRDSELQTLSASLAKMTDAIYDWAIAGRVKRLILLHKAAGLDFTGSDNLNFIGKAIVANDVSTLAALHAIDWQLLLKPVGWWVKDGRTSNQAFGPWSPLRFAAFLGQLNTVKQVSELSEPDECRPPHLQAVHFAALSARESPAHLDTWLFFRELNVADLEPLDVNYCIVSLRVEFDSDWGILVFPHSHEAVIEDVQSSSPERFYWENGYVKTREHQKSPLAVIMRVKMRSSDTDSRDGIVNVSFMHGWNDAGGAGGQGRVTISSTSEDNSELALWFRETDQQDMGELDERKALSSGTNWKESHHNLHSWELQCRRR